MDEGEIVCRRMRTSDIYNNRAHPRKPLYSIFFIQRYRYDVRSCFIQSSCLNTVCVMYLDDEMMDINEFCVSFN